MSLVKKQLFDAVFHGMEQTQVMLFWCSSAAAADSADAC
jgi:hypothetical protein